MDFFIPCGQSKGSEDENLKWWQLSLIGVGCTTGTGFFLGSAIGIKITGPSIVLSFTTAAGILILFNWSFIIISALRILKIKISCFNSAFSSSLIRIEEISKTSPKEASKIIYFNLTLVPSEFRVTTESNR